jgi:hypothetical protein
MRVVPSDLEQGEPSMNDTRKSTKSSKPAKASKATKSSKPAGNSKSATNSKSTTSSKSGKAATTGASEQFTAEEKAAMRERVREIKGAGKTDGETDLLAKIGEMSESDRDMAERVHAIVKRAAPDLTPRTWYGMPAYAKDGKVVCFFRSAEKFKTRYATLGFSDKANLDEGNMWPTDFALKKMTAADEKRIRALVKQAVS